MGGADQWGNITAGLELIRRTEAPPEGSEGEDSRTRWRHAPARPERREVRQDRGRHVRLARRRSDDAVRVLPVLARLGRRRGRPAAALLHAARQPVIEALSVNRPRSGGAAGSGAGARGDRPRPRPGGRRKRSGDRARFLRAGCSGSTRPGFLEAIAEPPRVRLPVSKTATAAETAVAAGAVSSNGEAAADRPGRPLLQRHPRRCGRRRPARPGPRPVLGAGTGKKNVRIVERAD